MISLPIIDKRHCDGCTICCTLMGVDALKKDYRQPCNHNHGSGCSIYDQRPQECAEYECLWLSGAIGGPNDRPDQSGLLFCQVFTISFGVVIVADEVWDGAIDQPAGKRLMNEATEKSLVCLKQREGRSKMFASRKLIETLKEKGIKVREET